MFGRMNRGAMVSLRKGAATSVAAIAAMTAMAVSLSASPATAQMGAEFVNSHSELNLSIEGDSKLQGAKVIQQWYQNHDSQFWYISTTGNAPQEIKNQKSGLCLAIPLASKASGVVAVQWPCNEGPEQQWIWDSAHRLRNVNSQLCLAIGQSSRADGAKAIQWPCSTNTDQVWHG